jgi:hypothetical protein
MIHSRCGTSQKIRGRSAGTGEPGRSFFVAIRPKCLGYARGQTLVLKPGICHVLYRTALLSQLA